MPTQVWRADDGSIFENEDDCTRYEEADAVLRLFYGQDGQRLEEERPGLEDVVWVLNGTGAFAIARELRAFVYSHKDLAEASENWDFWIALGEMLKRWRGSAWHQHIIKERGWE